MKKLLLLALLSLGLSVYAQQIYNAGSPKKTENRIESVRQMRLPKTHFDFQTQHNETEGLQANGAISSPAMPKANPDPTFTVAGNWGNFYNVDTEEYEYFELEEETYYSNWTTYYTAINITFTDEIFQEISTTRIEFPESTNFYSIQGTRRSSYFMIYDHFFRGGMGPDYQVHRMRLINNQGVVVYEAEERDGASLEGGKLILSDTYGDKPISTIFIHNSETFELEHALPAQTALLSNLGGPYFFTTEFEGETYFVTNTYEQPLMNMMTYELTPGNKYITTFYNTNYDVAKTVEIPIDIFNPEGLEFGLYPMPGYGMFREDFDITRNIFSSSGKWELVVPVYIMTFMGEWYSFYVFDEDGAMIKSYTEDEVSDYIYLSDIKGFDNQLLFVVTAEDYSQQLKVFNIEHFTIETVFDAMHNGTDWMSLLFDRFKKDDTYEYMVSLGNTEVIDNILRCIVKTYDRDGVETKKITIPMQTGGYAHSVYPSGNYLNPYLFTTDDEMEFTYSYRVSSGFIFGIATDGAEAPFFEIEGASGSGLLFDAKNTIPKYLYVLYSSPNKTDFYSLPLIGENVDVTINVTTNNPVETAIDAQVILKHTVSNITYYETVNSEGIVVIEDMFRGSYDVTLTKAGYYSYATTITLPETATSATFGAYQLQMYKAPVNLTGTSANGNATLSWSAPEVYAPLTIAGYNVYRNGVKINSALVSSTTYQNTPDPTGIYTYYVTAVMSDGIETVPSNEITIDTRYFIITSSVQGNGTITPVGEIAVNYNAEQTFTFAPGDAYIIVQLLVDGVNVPTAVSAGSYTFSNVTATHTIQVVFVPAEYTITATAGVGGTISPSGVVGVSYGETKSFTISTNLGYGVSQVLIDGVNNPDAVENRSYTFENIDANHTIAVSFHRYGYPITASAGEGGSIDPEGITVVNHGESQFYSITPEYGYAISKVLIDGVNNETAVTNGMYMFSNVSGTHTIEAVFELRSYAINAAATEGGSVTPEGITQVPHGGSQTYTFAASDNYNLVQVLVDGVNNAAAVTAKSYIFTNVTAPHSIKAVYEIDTYQITATATAGGTIIPEGTTQVNYGSNKTYTFRAERGYRIAQVLIDGTNNSEATDNGSYTFSNISSDHTIVVEFEKMTFIIKAGVDGEGGAITPEGDVTVDYGTSQVFTIIPDEGYVISSVLIDGKNNTAAVVNGSYIFSNVTSEHTIAAVFSKKVGMEDVEISQVTAYPNPTTGELRIRNEKSGIKNIQIFDMAGRLLQEMNNVDNTEIRIDITSFTNGIYFINADGKVIKVMKQ